MERCRLALPFFSIKEGRLIETFSIHSIVVTALNWVVTIYRIVYLEKIRALKAGFMPCIRKHGIIEQDFFLIRWFAERGNDQ
jgi:hypothetical protein